jgi:hypothetical protein
VVAQKLWGHFEEKSRLVAAKLADRTLLISPSVAMVPHKIITY